MPTPRSTAVTNETNAAESNAIDFEQLSLFRYRLRCFLRVSEDLCQSNGLTSLQYQLLLHVKGTPNQSWATVGDLAERLQAKHHGVVALIDRCEQLGLVKRKPSQEDRRQVEVHLLRKGEKLLSLVARQHRPELLRLREQIDCL